MRNMQKTTEGERAGKTAAVITASWKDLIMPPGSPGGEMRGVVEVAWVREEKARESEMTNVFHNRAACSQTQTLFLTVLCYVWAQLALLSLSVKERWGGTTARPDNGFLAPNKQILLFEMREIYQGEKLNSSSSMAWVCCTQDSFTTIRTVKCWITNCVGKLSVIGQMTLNVLLSNRRKRGVLCKLRRQPGHQLGTLFCKESF